MTFSNVVIASLGSIGGISAIVWWLSKTIAQHLSQREIAKLNFKHSKELTNINARTQELKDWHNSEIARIQESYITRHKTLHELDGILGDFFHFSNRVLEGSGSTLRGGMSTYCDQLEKKYWEIRDFARHQRIIVSDNISTLAIEFTDKVYPLIINCQKDPSSKEESLELRLLKEKIENHYIKLVDEIDTHRYEFEKTRPMPSVQNDTT